MATLEAAAKATGEVAKVKDIATLIKEASRDLAQSLPQHMRSERLSRIALTCIRLNPKLLECTPESFMGALFTSAQMGLEPIAGLAYILPYSNSRKINGKWVKVMEAQFIVGYKGLADLFYRHEKSLLLEPGIVKQGDEFEYENGTSPFLRHRPAKKPGEAIGYYIIATLSGGVKTFLYMSKEECIEHGQKHSKTWITEVYDPQQGKRVPCTPHFDNNSPWVTNPDSMCLKTVLVKLSKFLPKSVELQRAIEADETSRDYRHGVQDVLDIPPSTEWEEPPVDAPAPEITSQEAPAHDPQQDATVEQSAAQKYTCSVCTLDITKAEYEYSMQHFKKSLCRKDQAKEKK